MRTSLFSTTLVTLATSCLALATGCASTSSSAPRAEEVERVPLVRLAPGSEHAGDRNVPTVERFAAIWDAPDRDAWQRPVETIRLLRVEAGQTIADLGTGTGYFLPFLSIAVGPDGRVLALDSSPEMIAYVERRATVEGIANVEARVVSASDPGLGASSVDRVLVVDTWNEVPDRTAYASRLREALRPGGSVLVIDFTPEARHGPPPGQRIPAETVALELTNAGFEVEIVVEGLLEQYAVRGTRTS